MEGNSEQFNGCEGKTDAVSFAKLRGGLPYVISTVVRFVFV
jgi:hypothetical protein